MSGRLLGIDDPTWCYYVIEYHRIPWLECHRVLLNVKECCKMLWNVKECHRIS